ncbi:MAG TPA: alpha/beta fold hydrolase [Pyrinomonadaceae bacterium]|nr:alpha/beta fold hydrolase [Pyrinomonadaceae bacterium]
MSTGKFSLTHLVREPEAAGQTRPPLLVLLHGVGSNEQDLFGLTPYLDGRFLIVSARAPIEMWPGGYGWFNIEFTPRGMIVDIEQAKRSLRALPGFLDELVEAYGADADCVYLMGFSQGAMMSLALALTAPERVAGAVLMSGRFPAQALEREPEMRALEGKPFMVTHGIYDPVLPIAEGRAVRDKLSALPVELTYREYPMAHEVSMESLKDVAAWLSLKLDGREEKSPA